MKRYVTVKSVTLGAGGALLICAAAYPNDFLVRSNFLVGNYLPVSVFAFLFFFVLALRPILAITNQELVVALALMLAACGVPTSGLMRYFPALMTGPYTRQVTNQQWQAAHVLKYTPDKLVPMGWYREGEDPELDRALTPEQRRNRERRAAQVCQGLSRGIVSGHGRVQFWPTRGTRKVIPLDAWLPILRYWGPFLVLFCVFIVMMMVVVQPQWSKNELLPYPIAELASALIHTEPGRKWPGIFRDRRFWIACAAVGFIHLVRWVHVWYPETMINIPLEWRLTPIRNHYPDFASHAYQSWTLFNGRFYFAAFAFAFFIPTEVSFSLGITPFVLAFFSYTLWSFGYNFQWRNVTDSGAGAYLGMTAVILFLGRHYFLNVFRAALGLRPRDAVPRQLRLAARLFLAAYVGLVLMAVVFGLSIYMAILAITGLGVMFLVTARIIAETGSYFIQTVWMPFYLLYGLLGGRALGPYTQSVFGLITNLFCWDPRESLSCFVANGLKVCERENVSRLPVANLIAAVLIPCMAVAFLANLWVNYNGRGSDRYILRGNMFNRVAETVLREGRDPAVFKQMCSIDRTEGVFSFRALGYRLRNIAGRPDCFRWVLFGFSAVILCTILKLRYTWWIIHPIIFLVWGNGGGSVFSASFLAGCLVKTQVIRFGGGKLYRDLKSFFMGCIVGEIAMAGLVMLFNVWYYFKYDITPVRYYIFPG